MTKKREHFCKIQIVYLEYENERERKGPGEEERPGQGRGREGQMMKKIF